MTSEVEHIHLPDSEYKNSVLCRFDNSTEVYVPFMPLSDKEIEEQILLCQKASFEDNKSMDYKTAVIYHKDEVGIIVWPADYGDINIVKQCDLDWPHKREIL